MKLSTIVLYAVISPYLVGGDVTDCCFESCGDWCVAKGFKHPNFDRCATNCGKRRLACLDLCDTISEDFPNSEDFPEEKNSICQKNCGCVDKAAKVYKKRQQVVKMLSDVDSSGEMCDDSEPTEPPKKSTEPTKKSTKGGS